VSLPRVLYVVHHLFVTSPEDDPVPTAIYEFDASTLEPVGTPFERGIKVICSLALSSDGTLLASASYDNTINLWAIESRQLLASFHVMNPRKLTITCFDPASIRYTRTHARY
jgi:WD40 repeat protein